MSRGHGRIRSVLDAMIKPSGARHVCRACRQTISKRGFASFAIAESNVESPVTSHEDSSISGTVPSAQSPIEVKAGIVVSRAPIITPDAHPFEKAYHLYQRRLNERLVLPFTQYFYYRRGTPAFDHWKTRRSARAGVATRDIGKYNAYTDESWNDEVLVGDETAQPEKILEQLIEEEGRAEEFTGEQGNAKTAGLKRTTEADSKNDQRSLERKLSRTLYLLVKGRSGSNDQPENTLWKFPAGILESKEGLKEGAQRILDTSCGPNMNTWFVGNHPVGHHVRNLKALENANPSKAKPSAEHGYEEEKTFFMKARILAGQVDLKVNQSRYEDFRWLTKEEIEQVVSRGYWASIKNMLVRQ